MSLAEKLLATLSALVVAWVLTRGVHLSGTWDGDPSIHLRHAQTIVNVFAHEWHSDGIAAKAWLQGFAMYPKVAHEWLLAAAILLVNGVQTVDFARAEWFGAWFATLWALIGVSALFAIMLRSCPALAAITALPIVALSGYILLYANFPRHNMPADALCWLAMLVYSHGRARGPALGTRSAVLASALLGVAVPIHYSSLYFALGVIVTESLLFARDRALWPTLHALFLLGIPIVVVWLAIDGYFVLFTHLFPEETNWTGELVADSRHSRTLSAGLADVLANLWGRKIGHKIDPPAWWFLPGFLYRNFGALGCTLLAIGAARLLQVAWFERRSSTPAARHTTIIVGFLLATGLASLEYFQNARKLAVFYPAWAVALASGLATVGAAARRLCRTPVARPLSWPAASFGAVLLALHALDYGNDAFDIYHARRDVGYMREYLASRGITRILSLSAWVEAPLAPQQHGLRQWPSLAKLTLEDTSAERYLAVHRVWPAQFGAPFVACLRLLHPLVSFPNQVALPLFWYEFPLAERFWNTSDPLLHSRRLYAWPEVRNHCAQHLLGTYLLDTH